MSALALQLAPQPPLPRPKTRVGGLAEAGAAHIGTRGASSRGAHWEKRGEVRQRASDISVFENWNRFYDPMVDRYASGADPLLQYPALVQHEAKKGRQVPAYAYALNNPINLTDPDGLQAGPTLACGPFDSTVVCCLKQNPGEYERCGADPNDGINKCVVQATTALAKCLASGEPKLVCESTALKFLAKCFANQRNQCSNQSASGSESSF